KSDQAATYWLALRRPFRPRCLVGRDHFDPGFLLLVHRPRPGPDRPGARGGCAAAREDARRTGLASGHGASRRRRGACAGAGRQPASDPPEIVDYLRSVPSLWAEAGPAGRQALVEAIFARLDVLGF